MKGKVFHVDDETHRLATEYCGARGIVLEEWIAVLVRGAVSGERGDPVVKKKIPVFVAESEDEPWSRPPFWAGRQ